MLVIYKILKNADDVEGRGPIVSVASFTSEDDAWKIADTIDGPMGTRPQSGSWRTEQYRSVDVKPMVVYESIDEVQGDKRLLSALPKFLNGNLNAH